MSNDNPTELSEDDQLAVFTTCINNYVGTLQHTLQMPEDIYPNNFLGSPEGEDETEIANEAEKKWYLIGVAYALECLRENPLFQKESNNEEPEEPQDTES